MSNWDYIDEVDIIPKLPPNFQELRESKKWQERKEALEILLKLLTDNERLSTKVSYAELIGNLQVILAKDANIHCQALAAKCLGKFATGLRSKFSQFASSLLPVIFEKMKEKKPLLRDPLVECSDDVGRTMSSLEPSLEDILASLGKPNPQIKQQTALFVARQLDLVPPAKQPKALIKAIVPVLGKLTGDADADVREAGTTALGAVQRLIGDKNLKSLLADLASDEAKMKKINESAEKSAVKFAEEQEKNAPAAQPASTSSCGEKKSSGRKQEVEQETSGQEADPWDFLDAFDILSRIPEGFETNIESKKWLERKEALESLNTLMIANSKLDPKGNYGSLIERLQKILEKDANINVAAAAANSLTLIAKGLRTKFAPFAVSVAPVIFEKFKEKKPTLRDPLIACIDAVVSTTNLETIGEIVLAALGKPNPSIKTQTDLFLQRCFMKLNSQTMPKKTLKTLIPLLIKHSGDSDSEVRDASYAAMGAMMRAIGEKPSLQLLADIVSDNIKMGKIKEYYQKALDEAGPAEIAAMVQSIHKADAPASAAPQKQIKQASPQKEENEDEHLEDEEEPLKLPAGSDQKKEKKKAPTPKDNAENEPPTPKLELVLSENNEKAQRIKDEKQLKLVKWNFQTPTEEHISQLQTLIGAQAKVSLMSQLFHKDFKQHLSAVDSLLKLSDTAPNVLISNSDILLKWCTLRFFETNPAALIKVLELSRVIVTLIRDTETQMSTEELTAFVPYLLLKTGEAKENMRNSAREIVNILSDIVGPLKMCPMLLDALKSKNARQRAECLLVIESYISSSGIVPLKSLSIEKTVAAHVGDKDVGVRNAAINVLVACFKFEGDAMWKAAGRMADKDRSLVEERIKRSGVKAGSGVVSNSAPNGGGPKIVVPATSAATAVRRPASVSRTREPEEEFSSQNVTNTVSENERGRSKSRYALRNDVVDKALERLSMNVPRQIVSTPSATNGWNIVPHQSIKRTNSSSSISSIDTSDQIQRSINNISSTLQDVAQDAMFQMTYVLNQADQRHLVDRQADLVFRACAAQLERTIEEFNAGKDILGIMEALTQMLFILMGGVESDANLEPFNASPETVKSFISAVLRCIVHIGNTEGGYAMAKSLNRLAMKMIYRVELSNLLCGLIIAMTESFKKNTEIVGLISKLTSKWCEELEKRRTQLRASDIVDAFNNFYIYTLVEKKLDISNEYIQMMDNCLERVILQQGEYLLDAARRLSRPHMHLTSLINKVLQMMREQGVAPIMPGTLEDKIHKNEEESIIVRSGVQVIVDNIIRDTSSTGKYIQQLKELIQNEQSKKEYNEYTQKHVLGGMVRELVNTFNNSTNVRPNLPHIVDSSMMVFKAVSLLGQAAEQIRITPVENLDRTITLGTPMRGDATITRSRGNMIRQPKRTTMSREQLESIKLQLANAKQAAV